MKKSIFEEEQGLDLLYPSVKKRSEGEERRKALARMPYDWVNDLDVESAARIICPYNASLVFTILKELSNDEEVIRYRQEVLEDFLNIPQLGGVFSKILEKLYNNERHVPSMMNDPTSFTALSYRMSALELYEECIINIHKFIENYGERVKSRAVRNMLDYFEDIYKSDNFSEMQDELKKLSEALGVNIRSVIVGINFDEHMIPSSAGIISWSDGYIDEKQSLIDRIMYRVARQPAAVVKNELHRKHDPKTQHINEIDAALFKEIEEHTKAYCGKFNAALKAYYGMSVNQMFALESQLAFYNGAVELIKLAEFKGMKMCRPEIHPSEERRFYTEGMFDLCFFRKYIQQNPTEKVNERIITNGCRLDDEGRFYILTGANNGGKTTYLRGAGICQILAQAGLYVPASKAEISPAEHIFTHFPKEEEVGLNTSRFTNEIKQFREIGDYADKYCMLLMNESIQSTTPVECVDIASELLKFFAKKGVRGIFATHLTDLAYKAEKLGDGTDVKFVSMVMGVDEETEECSYKISKSLPMERSYAHVIFRRYGVSFEE